MANKNSKKNNEPQNTAGAWTDLEKEQLEVNFNANLPLDKIAKLHGRSPVAIMRQLEKQELPSHFCPICQHLVEIVGSAVKCKSDTCSLDLPIESFNFKALEAKVKDALADDSLKVLITTSVTIVEADGKQRPKFMIDNAE